MAETGSPTSDRPALTVTDPVDPGAVSRARPSARDVRRDLLVAAAATALSVGYLLEARSIKVREGQTGMTARDYPTWLGAVLLALSLALAIHRLVRWTAANRHPGAAAPSPAEPAPPAPAPGLPRRWAAARPAGAAAAAALYLAVLPTVGFVLLTPPFVAVLIVLADTGGRYRGRRLVIPVIAGCVIGIAAHLVFDGMLGVFLPSGLLDVRWGW